MTDKQIFCLKMALIPECQSILSDIPALVDIIWSFKEKYSYNPNEMFLVGACLLHNGALTPVEINKYERYLENYFECRSEDSLLYDVL
jgi:hypothetical protein